MDTTQIMMVVLVPLNTVFMLSLAFYVGRYVQRLQDIENRITDLEKLNTAVLMAEVKSDLKNLVDRFGSLHRSFHALSNFLIGKKVVTDIDAP